MLRVIGITVETLKYDYVPHPSAFGLGADNRMF